MFGRCRVKSLINSYHQALDEHPNSSTVIGNHFAMVNKIDAFMFRLLQCEDPDIERAVYEAVKRCGFVKVGNMSDSKVVYAG